MTDTRPDEIPYYSAGRYFRERLGFSVWKVSVDGGFGCPNRDATLGSAGCVFCDPASFSPSRQLGPRSIAGQLDEGIQRLRRRYGVDRFVAYLQPATNTHAPIDRLREVYRQAVSHPSVVGLIVGTRPDCVPDDVLDLLEEMSQRTWLAIEYGLQTIHDRTLDWMNRGHHYDAFLDAAARTRRRGLRLGAHVILGLPGESREDMRATARELARLRVDSVKLHNLHVVRGTPLADMLARGEVALPRLDEYVGYAVDFVERLAPDCVIDRLSGDAPAKYFLAPDWCLNKPAVRDAILAEFRRRRTRQGAKFAGGGHVAQ